MKLIKNIRSILIEYTTTNIQHISFCCSVCVCVGGSIFQNANLKEITVLLNCNPPLIDSTQAYRGYGFTELCFFPSLLGSVYMLESWITKALCTFPICFSILSHLIVEVKIAVVIISLHVAKEIFGDMAQRVPISQMTL